MELIQGCISLEHKIAVESNLIERGIEFITTKINQPEYEWLNGKEFDGGYNEALKVSDMGQGVWKQYCFERDEKAQLKVQIETENQAIAELTMMMATPSK